MTYYLKKNWKSVTFLCFMQILTGGIFPLTSVIMIWMMDAAIALDFPGFFLRLSVFAGAWIFYLVLATFRSYLLAKNCRTLNNQVRYDLYLSLLRKDHGDYHDQNTGEYISWLTNNVKQIETLAWNPIFDLMCEIATAVWALIALTAYHWSLLVYALVSAVVMWYVPRLFEKRMKKLGKEVSDRQAAAVAQMKDLLCGLDVLRFFGQQNRFLRQGKAVSDQIEEPAFRMRYTQKLIGNIVGGFSILLQIISFALIMVLVFFSQISLGSLFGISNLISSVTNGLSSVADSRVSITASKPFFEKITVRADDIQAKSQKSLPPMSDGITVENLNFSYGDKPVLRDLSMRFEKGGKYALTGPSGCGKSTLLKLLLGWLPDYEGTIRVDTRDTRDFTPEQLQQQMSYIEQDVFLFNTTIRDNITLGEEFSDAQMEKALRGSALELDLRSMPLGLDTPVGEDGSSLSGGQKQRVAIARALIHNRSILLVDEGTSALDQKNADIVEKSLLSNPDLTLILISHHLSPQRKEQFDQVFELEPLTCQV